jgi:hypothetical protein
LYKGAANKALYAAHVLAYASKLPGYAANGAHTGQAALFYSLPASKQAATAGLPLYQQQYGYRQHMRSSGARANGHWGIAAQGSKVAPAHAATMAANKLAQAAQQGASAAKQQAAAQQGSKVAS